MSEILVQVRQQFGSRAARRLRKQGMVPAVMYRGSQTVQHFCVEQRTINQLLQKRTFFLQPLSIAFKGQPYTVLPRYLQLDPLTSIPIHVSFLEITPQTRITAKVPCSFIHQEQCPGLRRGGLLNIVRQTIEVHCQATHIPQKITVDLSNLHINQSIHINQIVLPEGITPTIKDRNFTIAAIVPPSTS